MVDIGAQPQSRAWSRQASKYRAERSTSAADYTTLVKWLAVTFTAALALFLQLQAFPNHDVAWVLWGTREMLGGAKWGRDIIEPNPPLAWYLAVPSTWFAGLFGIPIARAFEIAVSGAALCSLVSFDALLKRCAYRGAMPGVLPTIVAGLFLFLFPGRDFGQREHLMLIAILPYLALVSARCSSSKSISPAYAVAIGLVAGIGFALKPYFLAVPIMVEAAAMACNRRRSSAFRPETLAIAGVLAAYGFYVIVFLRAYIAIVVPLAQAIYWSFDVPIGRWITSLAVPIVLAGVAPIVLRSATRRLPLILCAATFGFGISCLLQHKGYSYHLYPVAAGAALTIAAALSHPGLAPTRRAIGWLMMAILLLLPASQTRAWWLSNRANGQRTIEITRLIEAIDRHAGSGEFLVVAVHPYPAFPTALYVGARQVSRTNSQWFLPAVIQLRSGGTAPDPADQAVAERNARSFILQDLSHHPDLVLIDTDSARHTVGRNDFDFLRFYDEDPRFRNVWARYREIQPHGEYRMFVRDGDSNA